ncbi:alpha/beta hydrolase [Miniphocaeibacter halophilus]|uniref:Uncharacterized protein n=1 Tax=Miniphocaeibacter halophilus TaxID=2931922 RepID=A0AC61MRV4_9FIRM|nr:AcvB/VirJ family lysyl-phosphatidylglycerol hydrolase [Miniphocaeibacter halophilus]QQK08053.1 hypothetical protein JFY71_00515 [Miniphocaeibacter halophilus]
MNLRTKYYKVKSFDGYNLNCKFDYPENFDTIAIFCHGSGPNTYDNRRLINGIEFNYYDLFSKEFNKKGIAFCRWNTRGCKPSDIPPDFIEIDDEKYKSYLPSSSIEDVVEVIRFFRKTSEYKEKRIILIGISEGATIIPFSAKNIQDEIDALLLLSFSYDNLKETIEWQLSGGSSMVNMLKWFDYSLKGYITEEDFKLDKYGVRKTVLKDVDFLDLDVNRDGKLTSDDYALMLKDYKIELFRAIEEEDDEWLKENYSVYLTSRWFKEHFDLPSISDVMLFLNIPIYIFQGADDANIPITDVDKIQKDFKNNHKSNLKLFIFEEHDHDLNYLWYPLYNKISSGLQKVFEVASSL